jgi:hypothetical protein
MAANYQHYHMAAAAAWREPDSPQLSFVSGCSSLFSISTLQDYDDDVVIAGHGLPSTRVSLAGFTGDEEVQQMSGDDHRRSIRMMRNRENRARLGWLASAMVVLPVTGLSVLFASIYLENCSVTWCSVRSSFRFSIDSTLYTVCGGWM